MKQAAKAFAAVCKEEAAPNQDTRWLHFSASRPGIIPAGTGGSKRDLLVYENVVAMTETDGEQGFCKSAPSCRRKTAGD